MMADYEIIRLDPKDYDKCSNIWNMARHPGMTRKWFDEIVSGNRAVFVCSENGAFIGEGALVFDKNDRDYTIPGRRVYLSRMIVKPDCRNRGVGSALLDFLIDKAKALGYAEISIGVDKVNVNARRLYERKGFNTVIFEGRDEYGEFVKLLKILDA